MVSLLTPGLLALGPFGCDAGEPAYTNEAPPANVAQVLVTTGVDADGKLVREVVDGDIAAVSTTSVAVVFDRYLDPRTAIRQSFCLQSDADSAPRGPEECLSAIALTPTYDPVSRTVRLYLAEPLGRATHTLTVFSPRNAQDFGIRAFDGALLEATQTFTFDVLDENPPGTEPLESPADLDAGIVTCAEAALLFAPCHTCHADQESLGLDENGNQITTYNAPEDLSFQTRGLSRAIDRVARQTSVGDQGAEAATRPARFGAGMPIIERNNPGNSYAIYKVLARARYFGDTMADGELDRLQSWIVGAPMPVHEVTPVGEDATMTQGALRNISNWIAAGASCELPDEP